ncbi:PIN domain-containing protein [Candidatus Thiodictyon syntrophicum]|jgi:predicted nucleic acid-binding protein|uniref:Twitching motility protein PilT n=1 Tax=Candidatus Thiodictyon syntrophicum TaxID=1166950 RepID=A0A2K8U8J6_9GAMM|nr:PIN domain-containing protein [Candidatus Thiodictyon syntrophicum]AUB81874.1 twitching motility protein PilT [Candidatus Thiodictyon syntrophicum]
MTGQRFSVDTNILIYSIDKDAGTRHQQSRIILDALADADCVLTLQALPEFFNAVTRKDKMSRVEAADTVRDWMELFPVAAADGRTLADAMRLRIDHDFAFWDAMLVQAARAAGVTRLLTEDMQDGRVIGTMRLENPFKAGFDLRLL